MKPEFETSAPENGGRPPGARSLDSNANARISADQIAARLNIGRRAVYAMLEQRIIPGIRLGRRWIVTRHAYDEWEHTCGLPVGAGLVAKPEVKVLN